MAQHVESIYRTPVAYAIGWANRYFRPYATAGDSFEDVISHLVCQGDQGELAAYAAEGWTESGERLYLGGADYEAAEALCRADMEREEAEREPYDGPSAWVYVAEPVPDARIGQTKPGTEGLWFGDHDEARRVADLIGERASLKIER